MANYPVKNSFLIPDLPAWPAKYLCEKINSVSKGFEVMETVVQLVFNSTGENKECLPYNGIYSKNIKIDFSNPNIVFKNHKIKKVVGDPINFSMTSWEYQTCTQLPMPVCHSDSDIFPMRENPTPESDQKECFEKFGSKIDENWLEREMGFFEDGREFSNIIFTNGKYDPWRAGAVPKTAENLKNDVVLIDIEDGA